jgi:ElaB/YqjD/DUF883 family membrane-anchored ribosome-binding protein
MSETKTKAYTARTDSSESGPSAEADDLAALRERIRGLQDEVSVADKRLRTLLRERPFAAIATAVVAGFVLGRVIGRS